MTDGAVVVVGGTAGIGRQVASHYHARGRHVIVTGRELERAEQVASKIGAGVEALAFDLAQPDSIAEALERVGTVSRLVLSAVARDHNPVRDYTIADAVQLTTMKLVGYTATVATLATRLDDDGSVVLFGGRSMDRPFPGSTTVTTVNGGVVAMVTTLALEFAPIRVNAIHPGIVGDSPYWTGKTEYLESVRLRTPTGQLVRMRDIVESVVFLLENPAVNGVNLPVDGGWLLM